MYVETVKYDALVYFVSCVVQDHNFDLTINLNFSPRSFLTRFGGMGRIRSARQIKERYSKLSSDLPLSPLHALHSNGTGHASAGQRATVMLDLGEKRKNGVDIMVEAGAEMKGENTRERSATFIGSPTSGGLFPSGGLSSELVSSPSPPLIGIKRGLDEALESSSSVHHFSRRFQKLSPLELLEKIKEGVSLVPPRSPAPLAPECMQKVEYSVSAPKAAQVARPSEEELQLQLDLDCMDPSSTNNATTNNIFRT